MNRNIRDTSDIGKLFPINSGQFKILDTTILKAY